jgi:hypothetical protein
MGASKPPGWDATIGAPSDSDTPTAGAGAFEIAAPPEGCSPKITALFEYWQAIHPGGGLLPGRQHFDPLQVPRLLPHLWLLDVFRDPWRFRVRLLGTSIVEFIGREDTGRWLDEVLHGFEGSEVYQCLTITAGKGCPTYHESKILSNPEKTYVTAERLYLPLAGDGHTPDILLNMTLYRR